MQYQDWLQTWLSYYVQPTVKIRTYEKYAMITKVHISPQLGRYELNALTADVLQPFVASLCERLSPNSVNGVITVLQKSLKTAQRLGRSNTCFVEGICRPKNKEKKVECFTSAEQRRIEKAVLSSDKPKLLGVLLCLYTGLRLGELLALEWSDVDLQKGLLYVNKSCHFGKDNQGRYTRIVESPKTAYSERIIPLPKVLLSYVKAWQKQAKGQYVVQDKGRAVSPRSYQRGFAVLLQRIHLPHRGFHSLRHTFATRALESGMDVKTLSEILGHKNPTVTLRRYCHSLIKHKREMMNKLGKFCGL